MTAASHGDEAHDVRDPMVTWCVSINTSGKQQPNRDDVVWFRGIPTRDVALAMVRDFMRAEIVLLEHHDCIVEMDGQRVAFIPFALAGETNKALGMVAPEMRCRGCRRTL